MKTILDFKTFENMVVIDYLVGLPSGQIIDVNYKKINDLKQENLVEYNGALDLYVFKDINYDKIIEMIKGGKTEYDLNVAIEFFKKQSRILKYQIKKENIDIYGSVHIENENYTEIPFPFGNVSGDFVMKDCKLLTLFNSPKTVGGNFDVSGNNLTDLVNGPSHVGKDYDCSNNNIITLNGSPAIIKGYFDCSNNKLTELKNGPIKILGFMDCTGNNLKTKLDYEPSCIHIIKYGKSLKELKKVY